MRHTTLHGGDRANSKYSWIFGFRRGVKDTFAFFWGGGDITQCTFVVADVSGQPIGPNFKGQAGKSSSTLLKRR